MSYCTFESTRLGHIVHFQGHIVLLKNTMLGSYRTFENYNLILILYFYKVHY